MNLRDLHYLVTLSETKHFGKAAELCFVSQPTLSMQIKKLEEELDVQLIERNNKQVLFTNIGKTITAHAKKVLREADEIKAIAKMSTDPFNATIHVGLIPTIAPYLLPRIMKGIQKKLPNLKLMLHEEKTPDCLKLLHAGKLDAAILALPIDLHGLDHQHLYNENFLLALPEKHPLTNKNNLTTADVKKENLLLLADGHCLRDQALDVCKLKTTRGSFDATSLETLRYMVTQGAGVTLLPEMACKDKTAGLVLKHFKKPEPHREVALVWRKSSAMSSCFEKLAKIIAELI